MNGYHKFNRLKGSVNNDVESILDHLTITQRSKIRINISSEIGLLLQAQMHKVHH